MLTPPGANADFTRSDFRRIITPLVVDDNANGNEERKIITTAPQATSWFCFEPSMLFNVKGMAIVVPPTDDAVQDDSKFGMGVDVVVAVTVLADMVAVETIHTIINRSNSKRYLSFMFIIVQSKYQ